MKAKSARIRQAMWPGRLERKDSKFNWLNNPVVLSVVPKAFSQRKTWRWEPTYLMDQQLSIPIILRVS